MAPQNAEPDVGPPDLGQPDPRRGATPFTFTHGDGDGDGDGDTLAYTITADPQHSQLAPGQTHTPGAHMALTAAATNSTVTYTHTPDPTYAHAAAASGPATDEFTMTVDDGTITILNSTTPTAVHVISIGSADLTPV